MKNFTAHLPIVLGILSAGMLAGCGNPLSSVDKAAEALKAEIMNAESISPEGYASVYYVSAEGNDEADGRSAETAWKSLGKINSTALEAGSLVLFRRGDIWRGQLVAAERITYSAYGEGPKPCIWASPCNGAAEGSWELTETPDVWVYSRTFTDDIGALVFDDGEAGCTVKNYAYGFDADLQLFHDYLESGKVYLCSTKGNPAERFSSIEFLTKGHCIVMPKNLSSKFDNLCIKYTGSHGIGSSDAVSLEVTNCEFGWIGGSIQHFGNDFGVEGVPTRYGNAVEIWGSCDHYLVDHNWIYQVYDAGITHQWKGGTHPVVMKDVTYSFNLIEDCTYGIEYFIREMDPADADTVVTVLPERKMKDVLFKGNIIRRAGYGWGTQRPDKGTPALIKSWAKGGNKSENFVIEDNIFDRGKPNMFQIVAEPEDLPVHRGNTYYQEKGISLGDVPMGEGEKVNWI